MPQLRVNADMKSGNGAAGASDNIKKRTRVPGLNLMLGIALVSLAVVCICVGKYSVSPKQALSILFGKITGKAGDWEAMTENVVMGLRLPRIIASVLTGGALALSGAAYQGVFRNPLISPDFLGVSSGACIGAAIAILMSLGSVYIQLFAFIGGIAAVGLTILIPRLIGSESNIVLVLSGIIVGGLMSSVLGYVKYTADPETQLAAITYWELGSFSYVRLSALAPLLPVIVIPAAMLFAVSWWIDVLSLGEDEAKSLGANVPRIRNLVIICATLLTAGSVCISGTIRWIGLVIPHFGRMLAGPDNTKLFPTAFLTGGIFLLLADTAARSIGPLEMPISILTGLIGAPFYAWLLYRQRTRLQ